MSLRLAWRLGLRVVLSPGSRTASRFLVSASLAMALGLVPLVVVLSVADGMIDGISARTIETSLYHVQAWSPGGLDPEGSRTMLETSLRSVPGFRGAWPEQQGFALAYGAAGGNRLGVSVRGIDARWPREDPGASRFLKAEAGTLNLSGDQAWIGRAAADKLGLQVGSELKLLTTRTKGSLTVPRVTTVRIAAIVSVGYQELDRLWLFVPLDLSLQMFDTGEEPVFWGIKGDFPLQKTPEFLAGVRTALGPSWQAVSWETTGRSQFLNYQATRALLAVVMVLILLVAAVNVSTAMVTTVAERRKETALLKALGASDALVQQQFLVLGFGGGLAGALVGVGLGMGLAIGIDPLVRGIDALVSLFTPGRGFHLLNAAFYLESIPVRFDPLVLAAAGAGSVLLAVVASWWPARRAARERPLEVLRRA